MPIFIFHGNGLTAISKAVTNLKTRFDSMSQTQINGKNTAFEEAKILIGTADLFSDARLIILDNFPESTDVSELKVDSDTTVVFRFNKKIAATATFLKSAKQINAQIQEFSEADEVSIFPFLDTLGEKRPIAMAQFEKVYAEFGGQYILTMLYYFYRRMLAHPKKMPAFATQKLERQKQNFPLPKIKELYKHTLETDFQIKSGLLEEKLGLTLIVEKILEK